jgi:hypothetical protein
LHQRKYPGLRLTSEIFAGKTHLTAATDILQRGLEICFPGSPVPWSAESMGEAYRETLTRDAH